ncbi:MAG: putative toxin-antitoxin system toxin component, PIN family [Acidobacteria bacterium]|nr:putative toxin-antitoxin system toxin component, PIN family [Acidobacteriota bacterium]
MRILLDTNVLASAFATRGLCADVLRVVLSDHKLVVPEVVLDELRRVLQKQFKVPRPLVAEIEAFLREHDVIPKPKRPGPVRLRDLSDEWVVASALAGRADVIVSGDGDLLVLGDTGPVPVLSPRQFWEWLQPGAKVKR